MTSSLDRRTFLRSALAGAGAVALSPWARAAAQAGVVDRTGVALFTVRDLMKDQARTLAAIAGMGYRYVEGDLFPSLASALGPAGLAEKSAYVPTYLVTGNRAAWAAGGDLLPESYTFDDALAEGKKRGLEYLIVVYLMPAERGGLDVYRSLAKKLDAAGAACRKAGLTLAYHPHAFEYHAIDGTRPIDLMLEQTDPAHLMLELDTFWASIAGQDPVAMLRAHQGRVPLVHLKDKAAGTPVQYDERKVPHEAFKEIGNGRIDFATFFRAADAAGVRYFYVEQDYCVGSTPLDSLRTSRANIARLAG